MNIETIGIGVAVASGICHSLAYLDYNQRLFVGKSSPNSTTWAIFSAITILNLSSYFASSKDAWMSLLPFVNAILCIATFIIVLMRNTFGKLSSYEKWALALSLSSLIVWKLSSPFWAQLVVQLAIAIGFYPTYRMIWNHPEKETARPWLIWVVGYVLLIVTVILRWNGEWIALVYPIAMVIMHAAVVIIRAASMKLELHTGGIVFK